MKLTRRSLLKLTGAGLGHTLARALLPPLPKPDFYTDGAASNQQPITSGQKPVQTFRPRLAIWRGHS